MRFVVTREGRAEQLALRRSSGQELLDNAALATVTRAAPFAGFPSELRRSRLDLTLPITFHLAEP